MSVAIDNTNLLNQSRTYVSVGFTPVVSYVYDAAAKTVVFTDGSTIPAGTTLKVHVRVIDYKGNEVRDAITVTGTPGAKTLNVASLDSSRPFNVAATVLATKVAAANDLGVEITADGGAYRIGAAGSVGNWDSQNNL